MARPLASPCLMYTFTSCHKSEHELPRGADAVKSQDSRSAPAGPSRGHDHDMAPTYFPIGHGSAAQGLSVTIYHSGYILLFK